MGTETGTYPVKFLSVNNCDSVVNLTLTVNETIGIPYQIAGADELIIEPNPINSGGKVQLRYDFIPEDFNNMKVEVFNSLGMCIYVTYPEKDPVLLTELYDNGIYMVRIITGRNKVLFGKIIVQ